MAHQQKSFGQLMVRDAQSEWSQIREAEAQRKQRALYEAAARENQLAANATPETINKVRESVTQRMYERGQMTSDQLRAGAEIAKVFHAITCMMFAKTSRHGQLSGGGGDWPPSLNTAYRDRYTPWRDEQGLIQVRHNFSACDLVFMIVVDNTGPRQAADRIGMDHRTLKNILCESLYRYAEIADWIETKKAPQTAPLSVSVTAA